MTNLLRPALRSCKCSKAFFKDSARNLGVDFTLGKVRVITVQQSRLIAMKAKPRRLKAVKKAGVKSSTMARIAQAGITSGALYGAGVNGYSDSQIRAWRTAVHSSTFDRPSGRSATVDLQLVVNIRFGVDSAIAAGTGPVTMWASAWWDSWLPKSTMMKTFAAGIDKGDSPTWRYVLGSASVTLLSLRRIGWFATAADTWRSPRGIEVSIDDNAQGYPFPRGKGHANKDLAAGVAAQDELLGAQGYSTGCTHKETTLL